MNDGFITISQYVEGKPSLLAKIKAYNDLIDALELKLLDTIGDANYEELQMDDGQMKIRTRYRNVQDVEAGIMALEKAKQRYVNRYNGRTTILRGGKF